jgi:hypothetical protein
MGSALPTIANIRFRGGMVSRLHWFAIRAACRVAYQPDGSDRALPDDEKGDRLAGKLGSKSPRWLGDDHASAGGKRIQPGLLLTALEQGDRCRGSTQSSRRRKAQTGRCR